MIDLHCHILPDIDDGAEDIETSLNMCRIAVENGIEHIVATPHFEVGDNVDGFLVEREKRLELLSDEILINNLNLSIYPGAEVYVDDDIFYARDLEKLTINHSRYLLVEFAFSGLNVRKLVSYLNEIFDRGLIPIIAHPERYEYFQQDYETVNILAQNGVIFQINAGSLASLDGVEEFELAYALAFNGIASFVATDGHSDTYRTNNLSEMMKNFPPDIDEEFIKNMVHDNAKNVLLDREIQIPDYDNLSMRDE